MSKTGNVFADALIKSGVQLTTGSFYEWGNDSDIKFPFRVPDGLTHVAMSTRLVEAYNAVRRTSDSIDLEWLKGKHASNTDPTILAWMKANTSLLRLVDGDKMHEFYKSRGNELLPGVSPLYHMELLNYLTYFTVRIEYSIIDASFKLRLNLTKSMGEFKPLHRMTSTIDILNFISDNRDKVEFIPIVVNKDFEISHKAYHKGNTYVPAVSVSYLGRDILKNELVISSLEKWMAEGNTINPKNKYYIIASKGKVSQCYLRREKEGA